MTTNVTDYLIRRELDDPITREQLDGAADASGAAVDDLREEGVDIEWVESQVLENDEGQVIETLCHFRAESEDEVYEHAERSGLPMTTLARRGEPLAGE